MSGPEHQFQQLVVSVLENLCHFHVYVLAQPKPWLGTPGLADLYCLHPEKQLCLWLELKAPEGSHGVTDHQALFRDRVTEAGGTWHLVDSEERLVDVLAEYGFEVELAT